MSFLKNHPFAVEAFFDSSIVLTFAVPKEQLEKFIPDCLILDTFQDKWAFIAVAMVQVSGLRPKGFPEFMGNSFFLIGYRIFVRYTNRAGKRLRGLYIIKSETDKRVMQLLGNMFTHYCYTTTDIQQLREDMLTTISSEQSKFRVIFEQTTDEAQIPEGSPFTDWTTARRFAGPLPYTFTYLAADKSVLLIEGVRQNWIPKPLTVRSCYFNFLSSLKLENAVLANAFEIRNIPYYWKKGRIETWNPREDPSRAY